MVCFDNFIHPAGADHVCSLLIVIGA